MKINDTRLSTKADWSALYTKDQLKVLCIGWNIKVPGTRDEVVIEFHKEFGYTLGRVAWTEKKGTYGDRLYNVEFWK